MSPAADAVIRRLEAARDQWWLFTLLTTTAMAASLSFGTLLAFLLADVLLTCPRIVLLGMFLVWFGLTAVLIAIVARRLVRSQRNIEATARRVEHEFPELGSNLINLVQLSQDVTGNQRAFCDAAVDQAAADIGHVRFERAAAKESRWRRFLYCMQTPRDLVESLMVLAALILVAVLCHLTIANWASAASRLMTPWKFVPSVGSVGTIEVSPGDTEVLLGASLQITAEIRNPQTKPYEATLFVTPQGGRETARPLTADAKHRRYKLTLPSVVTPVAYRLEIGDSQTRIYNVGVRQKPTIDEVEVTYRYPAYLDRGDETFAQKHADLEAPQGTVARLRIRPSVPIALGYVQLGVKRYLGEVEPDGTLLTIHQMPLLEDATFTVHMLNDAGHSDPNPRLHRADVLLDQEPTAQLLKPAKNSSSAPGANVPVMIRAGDDHGLDRLQLEIKVSGPDAAPAPDGEEAPQPVQQQPIEKLPARVIKQWTQFDNNTTAVRHFQLEFNTLEVEPGQTVLLRAVARDRRLLTDYGLDLKQQEVATDWLAIRIADQDAESAAALQQLDSLRGAIWKILEKQIRARVGAATVVRRQQLAERAALATDVRAQQVDVQTASVALVESIGKTDREEHQAIRRILNALATGDMLQAVQQFDDLVAQKTMEGFDRPAGELLAVQDRIIAVLRKLLDVTRRAQSEELAEMKKRPGGDLPDDVQNALEEARNKLDEFLEQQKKVIEASEALAKKPVEDFSEEEEQKLESLAATEDEWAKFMKELHSDLSKLPEQDFANPALLSELVEIQTEIKMAEDALLKKTADIAVPLEQLGYEMAEEIKTNLEKWLPDTPDRERWSQEESLTDQDKEAPMAELPGELEDLIGELMEEEEDLFDEMEDVSSSAADSLDKGAGWDVADGPISNMSAKGATGNRLPNTSEIGGRAGEGRSGKSSGEFVGEEAIGKGGRKTPSRLTPDPYMQGQIKDHSRDPTGGATGGGKESGQGGEGLEGPVPGVPGPRELERLAGKQAALRNKAEAVDLQFQVVNFHHTDLEKLIEMMAQIERDLKTGRYQNALRQRKVLLGGLGNVKQYLEGEFEIRRDATSNLPAEIQKELLGSMQDPSPAGWEELNRRYFERLSTSAPKVPAETAGQAERPSE
ncbi:MAG: hypothetical protein A2V70_10460 [Planctomycetes bacterium RBG_13_63_9]|nr:MAG: hypothetical protein A2V70_10460 [Planctomycetes bacterium RBG_13_63_9]